MKTLDQNQTDVI